MIKKTLDNQEKYQKVFKENDFFIFITSYEKLID